MKTASFPRQNNKQYSSQICSEANVALNNPLRPVRAFGFSSPGSVPCLFLSLGRGREDRRRGAFLSLCSGSESEDKLMFSMEISLPELDFLLGVLVIGEVN